MNRAANKALSALLVFLTVFFVVAALAFLFVLLAEWIWLISNRPLRVGMMVGMFTATMVSFLFVCDVDSPLLFPEPKRGDGTDVET